MTDEKVYDLARRLRAVLSDDGEVLKLDEETALQLAREFSRQRRRKAVIRKLPDGSFEVLKCEDE